MSQTLSVAVYTYMGVDRTAALLHTVRNAAGGADIPGVVAQDFDGSVHVADQYRGVCKEYGFEHVRLSEHGHMSAANMAAVEATSTPWVLVCSDDVLLPSGFITKLTAFLKAHFLSESEENHQYGRDPRTCEFAERIAGIYLHCFDRHEIAAMGKNGQVPELAGFTEEMFYSMPPEHPDWWWRRIGYQLPEPKWSERTSSDRVACVSNVHGSAYVINRRYWDLAGGTAGVNCWQNDSVISYRIGLLTDGVFIRVPGLPSIAHRGGAAPVAADPDGKWKRSIHNLVESLGGQYDPEIADCLASDKPQAALIHYERCLKLRAAAFQTKYADQIAALELP